MTQPPVPVRLLIAGGGTGGHVLPAIAVIEELRARGVPLELLWVGSHGGVEREVAMDANVPFQAIQTGKLRRYFAMQTFTDALRIPLGIVQGARAVRRFQPDVIYSTGGAVSVPTIVGSRGKVPVLTHEQTAQIGIANKTVARFATTFAVGFEQTAVDARKRHKRVIVTGNPVRASLTTGSAESGRARFGFTSALPVIYVTGGARGASPLNIRLEAILESLLERCQIIHQTGPASANDDGDRLSAKTRSLPEHLATRYVVRDFIRDELADVYSMTDLVVARSGAGTVSELGYIGLPSILIPLPGTWGDEQRKNARILGDAGAALVIDQHDATPLRLLTEITAILSDADRRASMAKAAKSTSTPGAASNLVNEILRLAVQVT